MNSDPHATLRDRVLERVINGGGETDIALRNGAAEGRVPEAELQALVEKIHRHAYKVTDDDIRRLQGTRSDDEMFEIVVSAALGASHQRLRAGLAALDRA